MRNYEWIIEIRPIAEKWHLRSQIAKVGADLPRRKVHKVPHLTLVYNFYPKTNPWTLMKAIQRIARLYAPLDFEYDGFETKMGQNGHVLNFKINASKNLKKFRYELYKNIQNAIVEQPRTCSFNDKDADDFWFHSAAGFHLTKNELDRGLKRTGLRPGILERIFSIFRPVKKESPERQTLSSTAMRITLIKNQKIVLEYDVPSDSILTRREALAK